MLFELQWSDSTTVCIRLAVCTCCERINDDDDDDADGDDEIMYSYCMAIDFVNVYTVKYLTSWTVTNLHHKV